MAKNNSENNRFQYTLNRAYIIRKSNRSLLMLAIFSAILGLLVQLNRDKFGGSFLIALIAADVIMITVAFLMIQFFLRTRKIPVQIKTRNRNLTVDNWTFLHNNIESMKMTRPEESLGYFQMRKLRFDSEGKTYKFFFGPIGAIPQKDYERLYAEIVNCEKEQNKQ